MVCDDDPGPLCGCDKRVTEGRSRTYVTTKADGYMGKEWGGKRDILRCIVLPRELWEKKKVKNSW